MVKYKFYINCVSSDFVLELIHEWKVLEPKLLNKKSKFLKVSAMMNDAKAINNSLCFLNAFFKDRKFNSMESLRLN